jgi:hypothetical protein
MKSLLLVLSVFALSLSIDAQVRLTEIDLTNNEVTMTNMGAVMEDVSTYYLCSFPAYGIISSLPVVSGSAMINPGMSLTVTWASAMGADGECGLYANNINFGDAANMLDYMEWGNTGHTRSGVAVTAGVWNAGDFVSGADPYTFTGGVGDVGSAFWANPLPMVTFSVDMSQYVPAFGYVNVSGSWNGWCGDCNQLTDMGGGIWEVTLPIPAGDYDYKFSMDNWAAQENLSSGAGNPCTKLNGGNTNRNIVFSGDVSVPTVCFESCFACLTGAAAGCTDAAANNYDPVALENDGTCEYDVTMRVDMTNEVGNFTTPELNSSFNGWCGNCQPMSVDAGDVWIVTFPVQAGSYEYKFSADAWNTQEDLTGETSCATDNGGNWNRYLSVGGDTDQGTVCWGDCGACPVGTPGCTNPNANNYEPAATLEDGSCLYDLDLSVDMNCSCDPFTTVYVTGPFNGWCGNCNPLSDADLDGIWTVTLEVGEGSFEYKYEVDDWASQEDLIDDMVGGGSCAPITDFFSFANREVVISDPASTTDTYGSCDACNAASNALLCDLQVDGGTVTGFDANTFTYDILLPFGTVVIPVVSATTQVAAASAVVTDAAALPGTATVDVTSSDLGTMNTYTINFTVNANSSPYCETYVQHLDIPAETASAIFLTISNIDANTMIVEIESADGDPVDALQIVGGSGATVSAEDTSVPGKISRTLTWVTPPTDVVLNVLWSKVSFGGMWQLLGGDSTIPFAAFCIFPDPNVTFSVDMSNYVPAFTQVYVSGEFNGWSGNSNPMTDMGGGIWEVTLPIPAGDYRFKYTLDDWAADEVLGSGAGWPCTDFNGGFANRTMTVAGDMTMSTVCWESCYACLTGAAAGCTDAAATNFDPLAVEEDGSCIYNITMRVDMQFVVDPFTTPEINGTFNGWCGNCQPMTLDAGTVWMVDFPVQAGSYEFKFAADNWGIQENFIADADPCTVSNGGFTNRFFQVTGDTDMGTVCWESCEECPALPPGCTNPNANNYDPLAGVDDGSCLYDVIFTVDMNNYGIAGVDYITPEVNGSFNGWCGGCNPLSDPELDGVWTTTLELLGGTYEYQFAIDAWTDQEFGLDPGAPCTLGANRFIDVTDPLDIGEVCWESCDACLANAGCTDVTANNYDPLAVNDDGSCTYDVIFTVDMNIYGTAGVDYITPEVNGGFNGWCGGCAPMMDPELDGIWTLTISLPAGNHEYKFAVDAWTDQEFPDPAEPCMLGANRLVVVTTATDIGEVCWGSCSACPTLGCTDPAYVEFDPYAGIDDGSCSNLVVMGCTYAPADNFNPLANDDDGSCVFTLANPCPGDLNEDGVVNTLDLLVFLSVFGLVCP